MSTCATSRDARERDGGTGAGTAGSSADDRGPSCTRHVSAIGTDGSEDARSRPPHPHETQIRAAQMLVRRGVRFIV